MPLALSDLAGNWVGFGLNAVVEVLVLALLWYEQPKGTSRGWIVVLGTIWLTIAALLAFNT